MPLLSSNTQNIFLLALIEQFIREYDEREQSQLMKSITQSHPVIFMLKCADILEQLSDLGVEHIRILKLMGSVMIKSDQENSKQAVQAATRVLKKTIQCVLTSPANEEVSQLLTEIHVKLMGISDEIVINHISDFFESGRVPELVILKIIQSIFQSATKDYFRQFSYEILQKILSSLSLVKTDNIRLEYCELLQSIYRTLIYFEENQIQINLEQVQNVSWLIFDQVSKDWVTPQSQVQVLSLIGFMCQFVQRDKLERSVERLNQVYLSVLKVRSNQMRALFEGFNKFLERLFILDKYFYENIIKSITVSIYDFFKNPIFSPNYPFDENQLKYKNDLLSLLQTLSRFNIDNCLDLFINRINSKEQVERVSCLWICNFIISRNFNQISEPYKKQLIMQIQNLQFEQDSEVRYAICEIILQFCYKLKEGEQNQVGYDMKALLFYLFQQVAIHDREIEEYGQVRANPYETTLSILKARAQKILQTLCSDQWFDDMIWPMAIEIINNQKFSPGLAHIFKCLSLILKRETTKTQIPNPHVTIVRILLLIQIPYFFQNMGLEATNFLPILLKSMDIKLPTSCFQHIDTIKFYLQSKRQPDEYYEDRVSSIWKQCLQAIFAYKELNVIEEDFNAQMSTYLNSPALKLPIMKMQAVLMSFLRNQETIKFNLDKLFSICHPEYTNQTINLNIPIFEPEFAIRQCVADCFGYIGERHSGLVFDKIKAILNCEVVQKKNTGSFKDSMMSMFQKTSTDDSLINVRTTLIMALGSLSRFVNLNFIEVNILPNIMPFIQNEQLTQSLLVALENVSKSIEKQLENSEEITQQFLYNFGRYREQIMGFIQKQKTPTIRALNTQNIQLRLSLQPLEFQRIMQQLKIHLEGNYDYENEQVSQTFSNLFMLFLGGISIFDGDSNMNVWQSLLALLNQIKNQDILLEGLQKTMQRQKFKVDQGYKFYFRVLLVLLSIVYKNTGSKRFAVLMVEKVLLSINVYVDIYQKNDDDFNGQLITALFDKLQASESNLFINELHNILQEDNMDESLTGFAQLLLFIYKKGFQDFEKFITILKLICKKSYESNYSLYIVEQLNKLLKELAHNNLKETLQGLLEQQYEFPVNNFSKLFLKQISETKSYLVKSFGILTDVLNNPEDVITGNIGNYMVNASLFLGQLMYDDNTVLNDLIPKSKSQLLSTFILRFMTCHEIQLQGPNQAVQSAIWAFQNFLNISNIEGIAQQIFKKLLTEDEVEDGVSEIMMIYGKSASIIEQRKVFDFIQDFTQKQYSTFRLGAVIIIGQFIKTNKDLPNVEFYVELLTTLINFDRDNSEKVRAQVANGLGGVSYALKKIKQEESDIQIPQDLLQKIFESLIQLLDDAHETCIKHAMLSLQNLIYDIPNVIEFIPQLLLKVIANFEKQSVQIRISAFSLFSKICKICYEKNINNDYILNYLRQAQISIMLHLVDDSVQVRQICKLSLENVGEVLNKPLYLKLSNGEIELDQKVDHLDENEKIIFSISINFEQEYLQLYIQALLEFCKSPEYSIKGAAMFSLIILLAFREVNESRQKIEEVCSEPKLKWQTKQILMKASILLTQ